MAAKKRKTKEKSPYDYLFDPLIVQAADKVEVNRTVSTVTLYIDEVVVEYRTRVSMLTRVDAIVTVDGTMVHSTGFNMDTGPEGSYADNERAILHIMQEAQKRESEDRMNEVDDERAKVPGILKNVIIPAMVKARMEQ